MTRTTAAADLDDESLGRLLRGLRDEVGAKVGDRAAEWVAEASVRLRATPDTPEEEKND